ncbi:MAG: branched-chain amino acid ABC transporter permease [Spirochaetes bacterium]|nr:MAG: branched-chain amino acid ABC transporter permease [Spirochaetota bacterium]
MTSSGLKLQGLKSGITAGIPVFIGYFPIAVTFGLLAVSARLSLAETFGFSAIVFAGASQFMGLTMVLNGTGAGEIVLATFLLNFRHFLMSASLSSRTSFRKGIIPFIAFGITDETFSVSSMREEALSHSFVLGLNFTAYAGWLSGTVAGFVAGNFLPHNLREGMSICLYAMFVALLVPAVKKSFRAGIPALAAGLCNSLLAWCAFFGSGWNIIISILVGSAAGMILYRGE